MRACYRYSLLLLLVGCRSGPHHVVHVSGRVTLNGQPFVHAAVTFEPIAAKGQVNPGPGSGGITDADGRYTLKLIGTETQGAVVGRHMVSITRVQEDNSADDRPKRSKQLPAKRKTRMQLQYDVPAEGTDSADFHLTSP
jgi:hypothetical protein